MIDIRETQLLFTLDNLIAYHVLEPSIIHKMLGAYIFFEFDGNVCLRREASAAYFDMIMEEKKGSIKKKEKINLLDYIQRNVHLSSYHTKWKKIMGKDGSISYKKRRTLFFFLRNFP